MVIAMKEFLDIVNEKGEPTGQVVARDTAHEKGIWHRTSHVWLPAGEDFVTSALRELKEELGVTAKTEELIFCGDRKIVSDDVFFGKEYHDRQYSRVFVLWKDLEEKEFRLQPEEVDSVRWMDFAQCIQAVEANSFLHCIEMEELLMVRDAVMDS